MKIFLRCFSKENMRAILRHKFKSRYLKLQLILIFLLLGTANSFAQEITLKKDQAALESILKEVEGQSGFTFFYKKEEIKSFDKLSINLQSVPLRQAMKTILEGTDLEFEIFDKTIVIKKKTPPATGAAPKPDPAKLPRPQKVIRGKITDENNLPLGEMLVQELTSRAHTRSNARGEYALTVPERGKLSFTGKLFRGQEVDYLDTTTVVDAQMQIHSIDLDNVTVSGNPQLKDPGRFVEMKNRTYMSLAQVLQGTVPGLSLQIVNTTSKEITSIDAYVHTRNGVTINNLVRMSVEEFLGFFGRENGQQIIDQLLSGRNVPTSISNFYKLNTSSRTTSSLVPQVRGSNTFTNNGSNLLVVIDGFPQDGFPADYPMINVESIEVVKDQVELTKWGPKAAGGIILIKTKAAKLGKVQVNYTSNFYYTPAAKFSRKKLQLASTKDYLNYLKDVDSIAGNDYTNATLNLTPARRLFSQKRKNLISTAAYNKSLDSLEGLDNESQMALLQQDRMSQSHALGINGGTKNYKFNLISNYINDQTSELKGYSKTFGFNLNNKINLLKNKLNITWLINYSNANSRSGYNFSPNVQLEPYQMLLDQQGNYVNDYSAFSPLANATITANGYHDYGVNILQDARLNRILARAIEKKSNFNSTWDLLPGLKWSTSVYYTGSTKQSSTLYDKESSTARQLVDNYGEYTPGGINYYAPYGDILQSNNRVYKEWNARSALLYTRTFGKHEISLSVGGGAASIDSHAPANSTIYGYNSTTHTGSPVFLPTPDPKAGITNFYSLLLNGTPISTPYVLTVPINGDTSVARNVNTNAALTYKFANRLNLSGSYSSVYNPLYGQFSSYSTSALYKTEVSGLVLKNVGKSTVNVFLATGMEGNKIPDLPTVYSNTRYQQAIWNDYAIWVNGLQPTQQKGQSSHNIYQKLTVSLLDSALVLNGAYNTQSINGMLSSLSADPATIAANANSSSVIKYFSGGLKGKFRKGLLGFHFDYKKSPEGKSQLNGAGNYDLGHEKFMKSDVISALNFGFKIENISSYQGLGLMMGTNVASGGSFSQATNSNFNALPPRNSSYEFNGQLGLNDDAQSFDVRYYHQASSGLNNFAPALTDPSTGLTSRVTYSTITNKGVEFFFKTRVIKTTDFEYTITLNGAYNRNIAAEVPLIPFTGASNFATAYREGYDVSNIWSVKSAGLNNTGDPQIYDAKGNKTAKLDSATIAGSLVYSGVTRAPWTGGLIQEFNYKNFFARTSFTFNLGHVMRTYIPYLSTNNQTSALIADRWRKPGDEAFTDIPAIAVAASTYRAFVTQNGTNSIVSADNIRFQELMVGCSLPPSLLKKLRISAVTIALQAQNLALWTKNKLHVDPTTVSADGRIGMPIPTQYSCNLTVSF